MRTALLPHSPMLLMIHMHDDANFLLIYNKHADIIAVSRLHMWMCTVQGYVLNKHC